MAKDTYYFSHDYHARNDEKILELRVKYGAEGYGLFWMLVETMAENDNGGAKGSLIGGLSLGYGVTKEKLVEFVKYCVEIELFYEEDGFIFSRRMKKHKALRLKLVEDGKKGAEIRWGGYSQPNAKESKGKESKINNDIDNGTWESEKRLFLNAEEWQMKQCTTFSLNKEQILGYLDKFLKQLDNQEDYQCVKELKRYFPNWLQKLLSKSATHNPKTNKNSYV